MSMIGYFLSVDDKTLTAIQNGEEPIPENAKAGFETLDIDKTWHSIHYLLCKRADEGEPPMGYVVPLRASNAINCEMEYGAFYLTATQVQAACDYLCTLDDDTVKQMYNFQDMVKNNIYPIIPNENENDFYEYMSSYLFELKDFYKRTAQKKQAVIFCIV